jgi:hypothetical protein
MLTTWIDTIGQVVSFGTLVAIDLIVARWSMAFNKSSKHQRPLEHVDVIV